MTEGFGAVSESLRRSTVQVQVGRSGTGSGVVWSQDGTIVTNAHVAQKDRARILLWDGRTVNAVVTKRHARRDLALLQAEATGLPVPQFADSSTLRPGQIVIAVGNPLGFSGAMSTGVVHSVGPMRGIGSEVWVQADVRLAPGNSGGPLADAGGRVIGINTMIAGGLGLAIPSNLVRDFVTRPAPPRLGVSVQGVRAPAGGIGLLLLEVEPGGAASKASLLPGDVLVSVEGRQFQSLQELSEAVEAGGGAVRLQFLRGDRHIVREVVVRPEAA